MKNRKRITKLNGGAPSITVKINRKINFVGHFYLLQGAAKVFSVLFVMPPTKNTQHDGEIYYILVAGTNRKLGKIWPRHSAHYSAAHEPVK